MSGRVAIMAEPSHRDTPREFASAPGLLPRDYGMERLEALGLELGVVGHASAGVARKLSDFVDHRAGYQVVNPLIGMAQVAKSDAAIALLDQFAPTPAALRRHSIWPWAKRPLLGMMCWLGERMAHADDRTRANLVRQLEGVDLLTVWSKNQVAILIDAGIDRDRIAAIPYGVNVKWFSPTTIARDIPLLAVGQDPGRDYGTLFDAVRGTSMHLRVVCKAVNLSGLAIPPNVTVSDPVSMSEYRSLVRRAQVVVVPTKNLAYPTGQSVVLESSAAGATVVTSDTPAMSEYVTHGATGCLVEVGNSDELRSTLSRLVQDPSERQFLSEAGRKRVAEQYTSDAMWDCVAELMLQRGWIRSAA